jgi:Leucine-rich repeat (LRR) protein
LSGFTNLSSLSINEYSFEKLEHGCVNWETLTYLDIEYTDINSLDDRIVEDLYNLESLNISNTYINDIQFVLKLPNLKYFSCHHSYEFPMDKEPLKDHPNFNSSWLD